MPFSKLIGNQQLKKRIRLTVKNGKVSHCYLITGPEGSGKKTLAHLFAAALQCETPANAPCETCLPCKKVLKDIHPDVITVDDPDRKELPIKLVRDVITDSYTLPNEGNKKVYIFPHAEKLNERDQNALLKTLEEPPSHSVFLLLLPNAGLMLPTIRSRCPELALKPVPTAELLSALRRSYPGHSEEEYLQSAMTGFYGQATVLLDHPQENTLRSRFAEAYAHHDSYELLLIFTSLEKNSKDSLIEILTDWKQFLTGALTGRYGERVLYNGQNVIMENRSAKDILSAISFLDTAILHCTGNVNCAAICSALAVQLST